MKKKENKFVSILQTLLPMCTAIGVQLAVVSAFEVVVIMVLSAKNINLAVIAAENGDQEAFMNAILIDYAELVQTPLFNDILTLATMLILFIVFAVWFKKSEFSKHMTPIKKALPPRNIVLIVLAGLLGQICVSMMLVLILPLFPAIMVQYEQLMNSLVGGNTIIALVSTVLLAPFAEEFIFRGLTLGKSRKFMPFVLANTLQAFLFGVYHMNIVQGVYAFLMGLVFGYAAYKLNSIFASILFHASINGSSFLLEYIMPEALYYNTLAMILVAVASALVIWALLYLLKTPETAKPVTVYPVNSPESTYSQAENNF